MPQITQIFVGFFVSQITQIFLIHFVGKTQKAQRLKHYAAFKALENQRFSAVF